MRAFEAALLEAAAVAGLTPLPLASIGRRAAAVNDAGQSSIDAWNPSPAGKT